MVESLKELNLICQKPRYREVGNWMVRRIVRDTALPITWLLLHTPVTANQVTLASLLIGLVGILFFSFPGKGMFLAGAILLQFWYLLDHVDGQVARYRGTASLTGRFFDYMTHHLIHGVIFFSLGLYVYRETHRFFFVLWGFFASISILMFNLIHDTKYKTFFDKLTNLKTIKVVSKEASHQGKLGANRLRKVFTILHKVCEIHVLMNILTCSALLEVLFKSHLDSRSILFCFYAVVVPTLALTKITYVILSQQIDKDFDAHFQITEEGTLR